ncbi:hypothetical protein C8R45DRAFT_993681 [Mycena sanguinolenta]|nr:hypothetical protein C8R45DRAFT_993681 [Mycena sanguinolenta]
MRHHSLYLTRRRMHLLAVLAVLAAAASILYTAAASILHAATVSSLHAAAASSLHVAVPLVRRRCVHLAHHHSILACRRRRVYFNRRPPHSVVCSMCLLSSQRLRLLLGISWLATLLDFDPSHLDTYHTLPLLLIGLLLFETYTYRAGLYSFAFLQ